MSQGPEISVVMGVRDAAESLPRTMASILDQEDVDLELIVVDDGSTDGTWQVLERVAGEDGRLRPMRQEARGLTTALVVGCEAARAPILARQDAGACHRSLPGRLSAIVRTFRTRPEATLVSSGVRWFGPEGELIEEVQLTEREAAEGLQRLGLESVRGVAHHGAAAFPTQLYRRVGGYRPAFRFAQDLDLWLRLTDHGPHVLIPQVLVEVAHRPTSTTFLFRDLQVRLARLALEAARLRRSGQPEAAAVEAAARLSSRAPGSPSRWARAAGHYYLASRLRKVHPSHARRHFRAAATIAPWHVKAWLRWLTTR